MDDLWSASNWLPRARELDSCGGRTAIGAYCCADANEIDGCPHQHPPLSNSEILRGHGLESAGLRLRNTHQDELATVAHGP